VFDASEGRAAAVEHRLQEHIASRKTTKVGALTRPAASDVPAAARVGVLEEFTELVFGHARLFELRPQRVPTVARAIDAARHFHEASRHSLGVCPVSGSLLPELGSASSEMEMCSVILEFIMQRCRPMASGQVVQVSPPSQESACSWIAPQHTSSWQCPEPAQTAPA